MLTNILYYKYNIIYLFINKIIILIHNLINLMKSTLIALLLVGTINTLQLKFLNDYEDMMGEWDKNGQKMMQVKDDPFCMPELDPTCGKTTGQVKEDV